MIGGPSHWESVGPDTCIVCGLPTWAHRHRAPAVSTWRRPLISAPNATKATRREKAVTPTTATPVHTL